MTSRLEPTTEAAAERVSGAVERMILDGEVGPGDRLKLADLATRFGVGLMSVREALWKLEGSGLVENVPNRGALVRGIDERHIVNVYEVRGAIEATLIERAVASATSAHLRTIDAARVAVEEAVRLGDTRVILSADAAFHAAINAVADNDVATGILQSSLQLIRSLRLRLGFKPERLEEIVSEHAGLFEAIQLGDAKLAAQRVRLHTNGARRSMLDALRQFEGQHRTKRPS